MAESRGLTKLPLDIYTGVMPSIGVPDAQVNSMMVNLSRSCTTLHRLFKPELTKRAVKQLWQAMIDDDRITVVKIASARPDLLLLPMPNGFFIKSKYTHQLFDLAGETLLAAAAKLKQINMIQLLLPFYNKLEQTEAVITVKMKAISAWKPYAMQKNVKGKDELIIPQDYADYAQSLIDVFKDETFPYGDAAVNGVPGNARLSEQTELALSHFLNRLVPQAAVKLDEHIDVELLVMAIYKAYTENFLSFNNDWPKLNAFCVRVMGLIQAALQPEMVAILCKGLEDAVMEHIAWKENKTPAAVALPKLKNGANFYRLSRDSRVGLGFDFLCGIFGALEVGAPGLSQALREAACWNSYIQLKQQKFSSIQQSLMHRPNHFSPNIERSGCVSL